MYEPMLFEALKQITGFVDVGPYLKSFGFLERHIKWLEEKLIIIVTYPSCKFIEGNLSKVTEHLALQVLK